MALSSIGGSGSGVTATLNNRFDWAVGVNYKAGDVATVVGIRQVCRIDHLSGATPDLSKWTPTEGTDGFSTTAASVMTVAAVKPTAVGIHVFLVTPTDGLPSGVALKDLAYYDGTTWSVFRTYASAPSTFRVGDVEWYKFKGGWTFDTAWTKYTPSFGVVSGTAPVTTGLTLDVAYCVRGDMMTYMYHRRGAATCTAGSGTYKANLPAGFRFDLTFNSAGDPSLYPQGNNSRMLNQAVMAGKVNMNGSAGVATIHNISDTEFVFELTEGDTGITRLSGSSWFSLNSALVDLNCSGSFPIKRIWEA